MEIIRTAKGMSSSPANELKILNEEIISCRKCPRLVRFRESVARSKRRAFQNWEYWGRPIPGFGDAHARLLIIGLAPAAHGGNRTGRAFTGDRSGDFLFEALHRAGFANQPKSVSRDDDLQLKNAYIGVAVRCAPPANKPLPSEFQNCRPYLEAELRIIQPKAVLVLGGIALRTYLQILKEDGLISTHAAYPFAHGAVHQLPGSLPRLFASYHPSQQNTFTGRLTHAMLSRVLLNICKYMQAT
ncbi:MAG TPA: uracil-DNA glycosylase [Verrucomicrobiae bacterium]|nr:uracil-DNA glycosylase [Verrucomicrobiae bacterium]